MIQDLAALFQSRQTSNIKLLFITLHPRDYFVVFLLLQLCPNSHKGLFKG